MAETLGLHGSTIAQRIKPRRTQDLINQRSSYCQCHLLCGETSVSHLLHLLFVFVVVCSFGPPPPWDWPGAPVLASIYLFGASRVHISVHVFTSQFMCCRVGLMGPPLIPHLVHAFTIHPCVARLAGGEPLLTPNDRLHSLSVTLQFSIKRVSPKISV